MTIPLGDSIAVDEALLVLKALFLVLLYLFIWRIVRSASKDVRLPQESFILRPGEADGSGLAQQQQQQLQTGRLVVLKSPAIPEGTTYELDASALTIGRGGQNDVPIEEDEFASARHARFEPRRDGVWVQDRGSTNGTYVNGTQLDRPRRLTEGDVVRVGETDLRYER
jgi:pSer/pThr/pTyr-binding forkhead associated (FHA) protein